MHYFKNRIKEASTWAGIGVAFMGGTIYYHWMIVGSVLCGIIAVFTPDYSPPKSQPAAPAPASDGN